jgi:feruloyl esterase
VAGLAAAFTCALAGGRASADPATKAPNIPCERLAAIALTDAEVMDAKQTAAGPFAIPGANPAFGPTSLDLPAFCRASVTLTPSPDSDIKMELWLPPRWNGKFLMVGNGGWSGSISYPSMAEPLSRGYVVASTDTGHAGERGTFAIGHPEKLIDFAWRAVHETAEKSKALIAAYYGAGPRRSYWDGCSSGGRQGLKEVQQFPEDFDGVIAGAPANNMIRLQVQSLMADKANLPADGAPILGPPQFALLHRAVLDQCDGLDRLKDGEIADPRLCRFKASSLVCKPGQDASACLTPQQAETADRIYAPVRDPKTNALIYPGMPPGSELTWSFVVSQPWMAGVDAFAVLLGQPDWDLRAHDPVAEVATAEKADVGMLAVNPDLSAFRKRGGKLIQYHGWADPFIPTENSINYYESVLARQGGLRHAQDFYRLFLVPGMGHCFGAYSIDWITALEQWVEAGRAPNEVMGKRLAAASPFGPPGADPAPDLGSRPICAYPDIARYHGAGSGAEPADFACHAAPRESRAEDRP